jgi:hypothetical protein
MPTPTYRTPVRIARGTYANLNSSIADILEGEVVYATDQDKLYVKENNALVNTQADLSGYLTSATAASTYQTQAGMTTYLTTSAAGSTYAPLASPTFTGTVTIPAGASISGYLDTSTATSTYQTQAGMSSYLTTSAAGSTYAPLASPTFTGTVTIPAGASISGYAALASAQSFTAAQRGAINALGAVSAGSTTLDFATANNFSLSLPAGGTVTLATPSNITAGQSGCIVITQNASTAAQVAYSTAWNWKGGAPQMSTTLSSVNVIAYFVESVSRITAQLLDNTVN